jgi:hypothetical protein
VTASYTDGHGTNESVSSAATTAVANINDAPTGAVTIAGTATQGQTLSATHSLADADGLGTVSYQWRANGIAISGAAGSSYVLTAAEVGKTLTVTASYTDGHGTLEVMSSVSTAVVTAPPAVKLGSIDMPIDMPVSIGNINGAATSMPIDMPHGSFNNTAGINYVDITRSGNEHIFDKGASLSNKIILSTGVISHAMDAVIIDADQQIITSAKKSDQPQSIIKQPREVRLANNFRDLLANSKADYTVDMSRIVTQREEQALWQHIETMRDEIDDSELYRNTLEINVVALSTVTLTAGFVRWALRTGSVLASVLSSIPLLKRFDPLPIFIASKNSAESAKSKIKEHLDDEILNDKAERLFSQSTHHDNG